MNPTLSDLTRRLDGAAVSGMRIIPWSSPIPSFGDPFNSQIATLGLNPSNREFVDDGGKELDGPSRRFHTLRSLELSRWGQARSRHVDLIAEACNAYFRRNPYDSWFKKLDHVIADTNASFYSDLFKACHLDLIPYATVCKWTELARAQRAQLLTFAGDALLRLLRESAVRVLVLNGRSVVDYFEGIAEVRLYSEVKKGWGLPRQRGASVSGVSYRGTIRTISGAPLNREILVVGFNHNLQSSFGVTTEVTSAIREWIGKTARVGMS